MQIRKPVLAEVGKPRYPPNPVEVVGFNANMHRIPASPHGFF